MDNNQNNGNCLYNLIYAQFNEDIGSDGFFAYDLAYPIFFNLQNNYFSINQGILNNINSTIREDVMTFRDSLLNEQKQFNDNAINTGQQTKNFKAFSTYTVTFNKNHILSVILNLVGYIGDLYPEYDDLYSYNYDLLTGNQLGLKDVFNTNVNFIEVVSNYINYKIKQNPGMYHPDTVVEIPEDQSFYLTDDGIVIYFGLDEIAPREVGIPKFKMQYNKFMPYINPRFYCNPQNVQRMRNSFRRF